MPPRTRSQRQRTKVADVVAHSDKAHTENEEVDENKASCTFFDDSVSVENDENAFKPPVVDLPRYGAGLRQSLRRVDPVLRDITDQFRDKHPDSPSPAAPPRNWREVRKSKKPVLSRSLAPKPQALSPLPPSSPFPSTSTYEPQSLPRPRRETLRTVAPRKQAHIYAPTPQQGSDPFGILAAEKRLRAKRVQKPVTKPAASSSRPKTTQRFQSQSDRAPTPRPTNDEDFDDLYAEMDENQPPIPAPIFVPLLARATALEPASTQFLEEADVAQTFPDPLRTPRKRKRKPLEALSPPLMTPHSSTPPSSPSPVKVRTQSVPKPRERRTTPPPMFDEDDASDVENETADETPTKKPKIKPIKSRRKVEDGSDNSRESPKRAVRRLEALLPTRPTRTRLAAARKAKARIMMQGDDNDDNRKRGKLASKKKRAPPFKGGHKGKGKARANEEDIDLDGDVKEKYERERQARLEYFKKLEGYQIAKENVYIV